MSNLTQVQKLGFAEPLKQVKRELLSLEKQIPRGTTDGSEINQEVKSIISKVDTLFEKLNNPGFSGSYRGD